MKFTEDKLEQAFIKLLVNQDIPHVSGKDITRKPEEVLLKEDLRSFLLQQYKGADITESEVEQIIRKLEVYSASDLYESNKVIMKLLAGKHLQGRVAGYVFISLVMMQAVFGLSLWENPNALLHYAAKDI